MDPDFSLESEAYDNLERIQADGRFWPERFVLLRRRSLEENSNSQSVSRVPAVGRLAILLTNKGIVAEDKPSACRRDSICNTPDNLVRGALETGLSKNDQLIEDQTVVVREG